MIPNDPLQRHIMDEFVTDNMLRGVLPTMRGLIEDLKKNGGESIAKMLEDIATSNDDNAEAFSKMMGYYIAANSLIDFIVRTQRVPSQLKTQSLYEFLKPMVDQVHGLATWDEKLARAGSFAEFFSSLKND